MPFDHESLGIDLEYIARLPECHACRKKSDGAKTCPDGTVLCGTHFDEWLAERYSAAGPMTITAADYARRQREGKYRPCWEAKLEE